MQRTTEQADNPLHDAEIVKYGNERGEENNHWQYTESKDESAATENLEHFVAHQSAQQEINTFLAVADDIRYSVRCGFQGCASLRHIEDQSADAKLQGKGQAYRTQVDGTTIFRNGYS